MVVGEVEESGGLNPHVKEGIYIGRLAGVKEKILKNVPVLDVNNKPTGAKEDRPSWEWIFGVRTKEGDLRMTAITSRKFGTKTKAFAFAKGLSPDKIEVGDKIDTDELVGDYGNLTMKDKQRSDRLGNVNLTSIISDILPLDEDKIPEEEIVIDGLVTEEDEKEEVEVGEATEIPAQASQPAAGAGATTQSPKKEEKKPKPRK